MTSPFSRWRTWAIVLMAVAASAVVHAQQSSLPDFRTMVRENSPAVVNISTTQKRSMPGRPQLPRGFEIPDLPKDSPFHDFFRRFFGEGEIEEFDAQSLGSGFIISRDGYIISNNHVIQNADEIIVRLSDRREFRATLVGGDERSDVAVLKIEADDLPVVRVGSSQSLEVGEWVLAIGSPFGFDHSVTAGIVSAKGRSLPRENYVPFIQTDVAINPGNSGGPLFNLQGEVVGVNSQIFSRTGGFMGLSFAIPIDVAMNVADQLRSKGRVSRGWLGVLIQDVTRELAESFGMERPQGALIAKVLADSPAEKAGFEVGDVVLAFAGERVSRSSDLPPLVGRSSVGNAVPVEILRDGKAMTLRVVTAELPEEQEIRLATREEPQSAEATATASKLGVTVSDLTDEQREEYDVRDHGVLVTDVADGPAGRAGVRTGDVILMLNNAKVEDSQSFKRLAGELPSGRAVSVLVQRQGNPIFLALKTDE
ncbi:MAG: DegQ family serine endoprotease [Ectothiorhodospiraceae bacterium]|nr:DegQ family serine endoprotease [Ectothiorhodospiraceae bacterium]